MDVSGSYFEIEGYSDDDINLVYYYYMCISNGENTVLADGTKTLEIQHYTVDVTVNELGYYTFVYDNSTYQIINVY